jgi:seryl-tRNA synthetase
MHDIRAIRENPDLYDAAWARRGLPPMAKKIVDLDAKLRVASTAKQEAESQRNAASKAIGAAKAKKDEAEAARLMEQVAALKQRIEETSVDEAKWQKERDDLLASIPNLPAPDAPDGADEHGNVEVRRWYIQTGANPPALDLTADHVTLGEALGMMDFEAAARLSGARFVVLRGQLARLERALAAFMLDIQTGEHGYTEVNPPLLVKDHVMFGTGQLPKFVDDQFTAARTVSRQELLNEALARFDDEFEKRGGKVKPTQLLNEILETAPTREDFWLIPTAEVALTNLVREQILDEAPLPLRMTAGHALLPRRSGRGRQRHARHDPPAPIPQSRTRLDHHARAKPRRARAHGALRRRNLEAPRTAVPHHAALHRRHGLRRTQNLRPRSLAPKPRQVPRNQLVLELRRFPSPPHERALPQQGRQDRVRAHAERLRPRRRPHARRCARKLPASRRQHQSTDRARAVHGRRGSHLTLIAWPSAHAA